MLSDEDIQQWFDDESPTDLVSALHHMLDSSNWADDWRLPEYPVTKETIITSTKYTHRPPVFIGHAAADISAGVGSLFFGLPPLCDDAKAPAQLFDLEYRTAHAKQIHRIEQRREFVQRELANRPPSGKRLSEKRSERASKRPRGPRGRYLPQVEEEAVLTEEEAVF